MATDAPPALTEGLATSFKRGVGFIVSAEPTVEVVFLGNPFGVAVGEGNVLASGAVVIAGSPNWPWRNGSTADTEKPPGAVNRWVLVTL